MIFGRASCSDGGSERRFGDEYLNNDLKQQLRQQPQPSSQDELIKNTRAVLRTIQRSPHRIRAYFKPQPVRYAA